MVVFYNFKFFELILYYLCCWIDELIKVWGIDKGIYFDINKVGEFYLFIKEFILLIVE